jgi:SecD/SecF fusion protein
MYENYNWKWWLTGFLVLLAGWGVSYPQNLGLDLRGGAQLIYRLEVKERGWIGLEVRAPRDNDADKSGLIVTTVQPGSPASEVGLKPGDVVRKVDNIRQDSSSTFSRLIERERGKELSLDYYSTRGKKELSAKVLVGSLQNTRTKLAESVIEVLKKRLDGFGLREMTIQKQGRMGIVIQVPGISTRTQLAEIKSVVQRGGRLDFRLVADAQSSDMDQATVDREIVRLFKAQRDGSYYDDDTYDIALRTGLSEDKTFDVNSLAAEEAPKYFSLLKNAGRISGDELADAYRDLGPNGGPCIGFRWNPRGSKLSRSMTSKNIKKPMAISLDGSLIQTATIQGIISDRGIITGTFSDAEIKQVVVVLKGGALKAKPVLQSEEVVGPSIGRASLKIGKWAIGLATLVVLLFMLSFYKGSGLIANVALALNLLLILGILTIFGATLTLPGIAGILLTAGMAVDANILIFERIREELEKDASLKQAVQTGYDRAFWTIFDANLTTFITAIVLFKAGTGPIKGFAVTLMVGILCSMFTALFVTKMIYGFMIANEKFRELKMNRLLDKTNIDFMGQRARWARISLFCVLAGFTLFLMRGQEKYGLDFTGGSLVRMALKSPLSGTEVKAVLQPVAELDGVTVTMTGDSDAQDRGYFFELKTRKVANKLRGESEEGRLTAQDAFRNKIEELFADKLIESVVMADGQLFEVKAPSKPELKSQKRLSFGVVVKRPSGFDERPEASVAELEKSLAALKARGDSVAAGLTVTAGENDEKKPYLIFQVTTGDVPEGQKAYVANYTKVMKALESSKAYEVAVNFSRVSAIGPSIAYNLRSKAIISLFFSLVAIVLYITLRFEFRFGVAAIAALMHDVLFALGFMALLDLVFTSLGIPFDSKINLPTVAAFLTIVGYSLNDTIVVFDRIRENSRSRKLKGMEYNDLVNLSINQTLSRTILTSATTFFVVFVLFVASFFGLSSIQGLSVALMVGIVVGTYSSIFVASSLLVAKSESVNKLFYYMGIVLFGLTILSVALRRYEVIV